MSKLHMKYKFENGFMIMLAYFDENPYVTITRTFLKTMHQERSKVDFDTDNSIAHAKGFYDSVDGISWTDIEKPKDYYKLNSPMF